MHCIPVMALANQETPLQNNYSLEKFFLFLFILKDIDLISVLNSILRVSTHQGLIPTGEENNVAGMCFYLE